MTTKKMDATKPVRLFGPEEFRKYLAHMKAPALVAAKSYEEAVALAEEGVMRLLELDLAPANALDVFHLPPNEPHEHSRRMTQGQRDGLVRPFALSDNSLVCFGKPIETESGKKLAISAVLLWSANLYGTNKETQEDYWPPLVLRKKQPRYDELKAECLKEAAGLERLLKSARVTKVLKTDLRKLYSPNYWGRFIWRKQGKLQMGTSPPPNCAAVDDQLLNSLLCFFSDTRVLHEIVLPGPKTRDGVTTWRWVFVAPARVAVIIRQV